MEIHTYGPQEYDILVEVSIRIAKPWSENNLIYIYKLNIFLANTSSIKTEKYTQRSRGRYIYSRSDGWSTPMWQIVLSGFWTIVEFMFKQSRNANYEINLILQLYLIILYGIVLYDKEMYIDILKILLCLLYSSNKWEFFLRLWNVIQINENQRFALSSQTSPLGVFAW